MIYYLTSKKGVASRFDGYCPASEIIHWRVHILEIMIRFTKGWRTCYSRLQWLVIHANMVPNAGTHFKQFLYPLLRRQPGFVGSQFLSEKDSCQVLILTVWTSEAHRQRADHNNDLRAAFQQLSDRFAGQSQVSYCEMVCQI